MTKLVIRHAVGTWVLAHCLYPLLLFFVIMMDSNSDTEGSWMIPVVVGFVLIASLPAIVAFWGVIHFIIGFSYSPKLKLFAWSLAASLIVAINAYCLAIVLSAGDPEPEADNLTFVMYFGIPAVVAIFLSVLIRSNQFFSLNEYFMNKNNKVEELLNDVS
jgi:hypothetical protein